MITMFFKVPFSSVTQANTLARSICGFDVFDETLARGADRASAIVYGHGSLGSDDATREFARRISEVGGEAIDPEKLRKTPVELMEEIGPVKRPDLEKLTIAQLRARAEKEGRTVTGNKAQIVDAFEEDLLEKELKQKESKTDPKAKA